jgi:hypothetical protein
MNKRLLYILFITPFFVFAIYNTADAKKNSAPAEQTGALGEPSCGSSTIECHFNTNCGNETSILSSLNYDISITANGIPVDSNFLYSPGSFYEMVFTINKPTDRNGFSLTAIDLNNNYAGVLSVLNDSETELSNNNNNYVGHSNSLGISEWSFNWQAPAENTGNVKFFASANKGSNGKAPIELNKVEPCADTIIPVMFEIKEGEVSGINTISLLNEIAVLNNPILNNDVIIETITKEPKTYFISIFDLSGKRVTYKEQTLHIGIKTLEISLERKGIFIMNISTNKNETANYKILN